MYPATIFNWIDQSAINSNNNATPIDDDKLLPVGGLNDLIDQRNKLLDDAFCPHKIYSMLRVANITDISANDYKDGTVVYETSTKKCYAKINGKFERTVDIMDYACNNSKYIDSAEYNSTTDNIDFSLTDGSKISSPMNLHDSNYSEYNAIVDEDFSEECDEDLEVSKEYTEDILPVTVDKNYKGFVIGTRYLRVTIGSRIAIYAYIPTEEQRKNLKNLSKPFPVIKEIFDNGKEIVIDRCKMSEIIKEEIEDMLAKRGT